MRRLLLLSLVLVGGCIAQPLPLRPSAVCTTDSDCAAWEVRNNIPEHERCYGAPCSALHPLHHNIPATLEDGSLVYLCATQPREYSDGRTVEDHYIQRAPCPEVPIK